jgi:hypothetical protein
MFNYVDDLVFVVHVDEIKRKEYAKRMNPARREYPQTLIDPQPDLSDQTFEAREYGVGGKNAEA